MVQAASPVHYVQERCHRNCRDDQQYQGLRETIAYGQTSLAQPTWQAVLPTPSLASLAQLAVHCLVASRSASLKEGKLAADAWAFKELLDPEALLTIGLLADACDEDMWLTREMEDR